MYSKLTYVLSVILLILSFRYLYMNKESFQKLEKFAGPAQLANGRYIISNLKGDNLVSNAFTPVVCNDFFFPEKSKEPSQIGWNLVRISEGVYQLNKTNNEEDECMYAHDSGQVRSFIIKKKSGCKNMCGSDKLNSSKELDPYSVRTYFKIITGEEINGIRSYLVQSLKTNQYVKFDGKHTFFTQYHDKDCLLTFNKV
jgi:hypothetical protein